MSSDITIYCAEYVVPIASEPIQGGGVAVNKNKIEEIGTSSDLRRKFPASRIVDCGQSAILPGLVNCHTHLELAAFRGGADAYDHDFGAWLYAVTNLRRDRESVDDINLSALLGAAELAASGVTSVGDIGRIGGAGLAALTAVGLRGTVYQETDFSPLNSNADRDFDLVRKKFEGHASEYDGIVQPGISPHSPYTVSRRLFELVTDYAIENDVDLSIHAAESKDEAELMTAGAGSIADLFERESIAWEVPGKTTLRYLNDIGVLESSPLLAHCIQVSNEEIDLIGASGTRVAHCPKSNTKFGHGIAPLRSLLDKRIAVGIGTDSMVSNNSCDMFDEARFALSLSRIDQAGNEFVQARTLVEMLTTGGAHALGIGNQTGTLESGKQADLIVISIDGLGQTPVRDIFSTLVFSTSASSVSRTIVAGETIYSDGSFTNIDTDDIRLRVNQRFLKDASA